MTDSYKPRLLSDDETKKCIEWLDSKIKGCPACHERRISFTPSIEIVAAGLSPDGKEGWVMPCVTTICDNCGHVDWYNAVSIGIEAPYENG